ncbi:MAG: hypothetical protein ACSHXB_13325 [Sulfitobacter sp.]
MLRPFLMALPIFAAAMVQAADVPPAMTGYIDSDVMPWVNDAQIVSAINAQNAQSSGLSQDDIIAQDNAWRAQVGTAESPMIDQVLSAPLSAFLNEHVTASQGRITEVFVMDNRGLNVASSAVTSDYWQGDEAKFQKSFEMGPGSVFVDDIELDESTQTYQGQVSIAITDPATGKAIGAITVGLDAGAFF